MSASLKRLSVAFLLTALASLAWWAVTNRPVDAGPDIPDGQLRSVSFAPFRDGQSPLLKVYPTPQQIEEDLARLQGRVRSVRTYTSREGMELVPQLARKYGLKVTMGAWLGPEHGPKAAEGRATNRAEVDALVNLANAFPDVIERVIVGNEVLLRRDLPPEKLLSYVREVKSRVKQPVSYADVWAFHLKNPEVTAALDYVTIHILPYWEDEPVHVEGVGPHIEHYYRVIHEAFPGKPILIGEAGWPTMGRSRGPAAPGVVNAATFVRTLVEVADRNGFDYNVVEAYDQPWKAALEGTVGAKWGLWTMEREPVFPLTGPVAEHDDWPVRFALSLLIAAALLAPFYKRFGGPWAFGVAALAQAMAVALVQYGYAAGESGISFWAKFNFGLAPRLLAGGFAALLVVFAAGLVERAVHVFDGRDTTAMGRFVVPLHRVFALVAAFLTIAIVLDGRYRDLPVLHFAVPVIGLIGLSLLRLLSGRDTLSAFAGWEMFGRRPDRRGKIVAALLLALAIANLVAEGTAIIGEDFAVMHPTLADQAPLILRAMVSNWSALLWSAMLVGLALPHLADLLLLRRAKAPLHLPV